MQRTFDFGSRPHRWQPASKWSRGSIVRLFGLAQAVQRLAEMAHYVELVEQGVAACDVAAIVTLPSDAHCNGHAFCRVLNAWFRLG